MGCEAWGSAAPDRTLLSSRGVWYVHPRPGTLGGVRYRRPIPGTLRGCRPLQLILLESIRLGLGRNEIKTICRVLQVSAQVVLQFWAPRAVETLSLRVDGLRDDVTGGLILILAT